MEILNWATDCIDERDYIYEVAWWIEIKDYIVNDNWIIQDQSKAGYNMWCVYFSSSMHDNYLNNRDKIEDRTTWWSLCDESSTRSSDSGDVIINWPKLLQTKDLIKWFFKILDLNWILENLSNWNCIHTGSNQINRKETYNSKDKISIMNWWSWHCFYIIWYNNSGSNKTSNDLTIPDKTFICKNSYNYFSFFLVKFEDIDKLFNKYYFENNIQIILDYKQKIMDNIKLDSSKRAFELGLWNGLDWEKPVSREECSAMLYRLYEKLSK